MSTTSYGGASSTAPGKEVRTAAKAVGAVFLLVGILGFIPGITSNYDQMSFAGHMSGAKLLGLFQVSVLHNIVHLLFGVAGLALSRATRTAFLYLVGGGVIYLVLWIYGLVVDMGSQANFVPLNTADNWLHLLLGLGMVAVGFLTYRAVGPRSGVSEGAQGTQR